MNVLDGAQSDIKNPAKTRNVDREFAKQFNKYVKYRFRKKDYTKIEKQYVSSCDHSAIT